MARCVTKEIANSLLTCGLLAAFVVAGCSKTHKNRHGSGDSSSVVDQSDNQSSGGTDQLTQFEANWGFKSGGAILNTYVAATGLTPSSTLVALFNDLQSSLPVVPRVQNFDAGKQGAIVKLAGQFCVELMAAPALKQKFFPSVNLGLPASALSPDDRATIAKNLIDIFWKSSMELNDRAYQVGVLVDLQNQLIAGGVASSTDLATSVCTAVASSISSTIL